MQYDDGITDERGSLPVLIKALFLLANLLNKVIFGLALILIARQVAPDQFGQFSTYASITNFLLAFLSLGMIEYFLIVHAKDINAATTNLLLWFFIAIISALFVSYFFTDTLFFYVLLWTIMTKNAVQLAASVWQVKAQYRGAVVLYFYATATLIMMLVLFDYYDLHLQRFLQWSILANMPIILLMLLLLKEQRAYFDAFGSAFLKGSFRFSFSFSLAYVYMSSDVVMLNYLSSSRDAGLYSAATAVLFITYLVMDIFYRFFLPYYSKNIGQKGYVYINDFFALVIAVIVPVFLLVAFYHQEMIAIIYKRAYGEAAQYMIPLSLILFLHTFCYPLGLVISARGLQHKKNSIQMGVALLNITANLLLIPFFHVHGAIAATVLSEMLLLYRYYALAGTVEKNIHIDWSGFLKTAAGYSVVFLAVFLAFDDKMFSFSILVVLAMLLTIRTVFKSSIMSNRMP